MPSDFSASEWAPPAAMAVTSAEGWSGHGGLPGGVVAPGGDGAAAVSAREWDVPAAMAVYVLPVGWCRHVGLPVSVVAPGGDGAVAGERGSPPAAILMASVFCIGVTASLLAPSPCCHSLTAPKVAATAKMVTSPRTRASVRRLRVFTSVSSRCGLDGGGVGTGGPSRAGGGGGGVTMVTRAACRFGTGGSWTVLAFRAGGVIAARAAAASAPAVG